MASAQPTQKILKLLEGWMKQVPKIGDVVTGVVIAKEPRRLFINLGPIGTGVVFGTEYIKSRDKIKNLQPGDSVNVKILSFENEEGYVEVSLKEADKYETWNRIRALKQERAILNLPVIEANRGGLIMELFGIRGFLPVSQLAPEHYPRVEGGVEGDGKEKILERLKEFVGQEMRVRILDISPNEERLIFSERDAKEEDIRALVARYNVGDVVEGEITAVVNFGAFMKFGEPPLEGLIHISEFDYKVVDDPRAYVSVGDPVKAKIIAIDQNRISLSLKALKENPWDRVLERYERDAVYPGRVLKIIPLGALVELDPEIHGIAHVAHFGGNLEVLKQSIAPGNTYPFRVVSIEPKEKRIILALHREEPQAA